MCDSNRRVRRQVVAGRIAGNVGATHRHRVDVVAARERVAGEELARGGGVQIDAPAGLVQAVAADQRLAVDRRRDVAERVERHDVARHRVDGPWRQLVAGERHAAGGDVDERRREAGEIAGTLLRRRHGRRRRDPLLVEEALVVGEHERAIGAERTADRAAGLMLVERLDVAREEVAGVERVVAHEVVEAAVVLIAARTRHDAGRRAAGAAVLGRRALRQDPELGDGVDRHFQRVAAVHAVHVLHAVHEVDVLLGPHAVDGVGLPLPQRAAGGGDAERQRRDAGLQQAELREVAAVQRQVLQLAAGDHAAERVGGRVDQLRAAADRDRFLQCRQLEPHRDAHRLAHRDLDRLLEHRRELRRPRGDAVGADGEQRQPEVAVTAGDRLAREAGLEMARGHAGAGDGARRLVGDGTFDGAGRILRPGGCGRGDHSEQRHCGEQQGSHGARL